MSVIASDRPRVRGVVSVGDALERQAPGFFGHHAFGIFMHSPSFALRGMTDGRTKRTPDDGDDGKELYTSTEMASGRNEAIQASL